MVLPLDHDPRTRYSLRKVYEEYKRSKRDPKRTVESALNAIAHWEGVHGALPICEIDNAACHRFQESLLAGGLAVSTVNKVCREVSAILTRVGQPGFRNRDAVGILETVPYFRMLKEPEKEIRILSEADCNAIYRACEIAWWPNEPQVSPVDWWRCLLVVLWNLGYRRNTWLIIEQKHIDLEARTITVPSGKSGKVRTKHLNAATLSHIQRIWQPPRQYLFCCARSAARIDSSMGQIYKVWRAIQTDAGIEEGQHYTFHDLRRTCGSQHFAANPAAAQNVLEHGSIRTTQNHYARFLPDSLRQVSDNLQQPSAFSGNSAPQTPPPTPPTQATSDKLDASNADQSDKPDDAGDAGDNPDILPGPWRAA